MSVLWLTPDQAKTITAHARAEQPREACGLIAGKGERAIEIIAVANAARDPLHAYYMDERALATALTSLDARGLELIGLYHSHPASDPIPSPTDIRQVSYPATPYLIVGLKSGHPQLAVWSIRAGQVGEVTLHIGSEPPLSQRTSLSNAQKAAILLGALIAVAVMIVVSLSLLPPAPAH